jgi:hypothetical protein
MVVLRLLALIVILGHRNELVLLTCSCITSLTPQVVQVDSVRVFVFESC